MTKKQFISVVMSDVTVGGLLPVNVPTDRILQIVENTLETFRDRDDRMTQNDILLIWPKKGCKIVNMPHDVKAVTRLEFTYNGAVPREFSGIVDEGRVYHTNGENDMLSYVTREAYYQLVRDMGVRFMPYDFSEYTHELLLEGDPMGKSLFAEVARYISAENAYKINDFRMYCGAKITLDWVKANSFLKIKLPQNREIDWDAIKEDAEKTIDAQQESWGGNDYGFIMTD